MSVKSRKLSSREQADLLGPDVDRLSEKEAQLCLAAASKSKTHHQVSDLKFPLTKFRWRHSRFSDVRFSRCDLGAPFVTRRPFQKRLFTRCGFESVSMDGLNLNSCAFRDCSFTDVVFGRKFYGLLSKSSFCDCSFEACSLSYVEFASCTFDDCSFSDIEGTHTRFRSCRVQGTTLEGTLRTGQFNRCHLNNVDLSGCQYEDFSFLETTYENVQLPQGKNSFFVDRMALQELLPHVRENCSADASDWIEFLSETEDLQPVSESLFEELSNSDREFVVRLLYPERVSNPFSQ